MMRDRQRTVCKQWQYRPFIDVARCHHLRCVCVWMKIWWICEKCAPIFSGEIIRVIVTGEKWIGKKWIGMNGTWHFTYDRTSEIGKYIGADAWLRFDSFVWFRSWERLAAHSALFSIFSVSNSTFVAHSWSKTKTKDENYMRITNINDTRSNLCTLRAAELSAIPVNNKFYEIINVFYDGCSVSLWFSVCGFFSFHIFVGVHLSASLRHRWYGFVSYEIIMWSVARLHLTLARIRAGNRIYFNYSKNMPCVCIMIRNTK